MQTLLTRTLSRRSLTPRRLLSVLRSTGTGEVTVLSAKLDERADKSKLHAQNIEMLEGPDLHRDKAIAALEKDVEALKNGHKSLMRKRDLEALAEFVRLYRAFKASTSMPKANAPSATPSSQLE